MFNFLNREQCYFTLDENRVIEKMNFWEVDESLFVI